MKQLLLPFIFNMRHWSGGDVYELVKEKKSYLIILFMPIYLTFISFIIFAIEKNLFTTILVLFAFVFMIMNTQFVSMTLRQFMEFERAAYVDHAAHKESEYLRRERELERRENNLRLREQQLNRDRVYFEKQKTEFFNSSHSQSSSKTYKGSKVKDDDFTYEQFFKGTRQRNTYQQSYSPHIIKCFSILGLATDSGLSEIKKAYRKLVKHHHPDMGGDQKKFEEIHQAYTDLCNHHKTA